MRATFLAALLPTAPADAAAAAYEQRVRPLLLHECAAFFGAIRPPFCV